MTIIPLGRLLPAASSDLPGSSGGQPSNAPLFGLAPGGVYKAFPVTRKTGALLPHHFTLTRNWPCLRTVFSGGIFSVALSFASPRLHVMKHPALWCSDFPPDEDSPSDRLFCFGRFTAKTLTSFYFQNDIPVRIRTETAKASEQR